MVHHFLASPFTDAARAGQYAAVRAALEADATTDSLLLGNLVLEDGAAVLDAVVVRPHGITLLVLVPGGGRLSIPTLGYGRWQLNGAPLAGADEFDNPFEQFVQQKTALESWLRPRFNAEQVNLRFITGIVLFGAAVVFAPDVEPALNTAATTGFQLLSEVPDLPRRLRQLATPEIDLGPDDLAEWADELTAFAATELPTPLPAGPAPDGPQWAGAGATRGESAAPAPDLPPAFTIGAPAAAPSGFLGQKAKALWGWLGAADVPDDDPAYGYDPDAAAARSEEKQQLERLRLQMQADVNGQLQALEAREAERERSIAQLRAELAQAPPVAAEATALVSRLGAETREKAALEVEMQASRAESAARNQELDAKILQLGQLIDQLSTRPPASAAAPATVASAVEEPPTVPAAVAPLAPAAPAAIVPAVAVPAAPVAALSARFAAPELPGAPPAGLAQGGSPQPSAGPANAAPVSRMLAGAISLASVLAARVKLLGAELQPRARQVGEWGRQRPRVVLVAVGLAVVGLGAWGLGRTGGDAPVPFQENGRWGYADASGRPVVPAQYTAASPFQAGQAVVAKDGAYGVVNEAGKEVVPPVYDALNPFADGFARVRVGDAYTFVDEDGQEFDHYYFNALDFAEGRAAVLDHRGWHYIGGPAEPTTPPAIFPEAYSFVGGLARVKLPDGYSYITPDYLDDPSRGTKPFGRYDLATDFADGKARVTQAGRSFVIDKDGDKVK